MMNAAEYERALAVMDEVFDAPEGSDAARVRDSLVEEIERYEDLHYPIGIPDLKSAITARLDDLDVTPNDTRFSDEERLAIRAVLVGGPEPSASVVRSVIKKLSIPAEVLKAGGRKG